jgi:hypothetical protein
MVNAYLEAEDSAEAESPHDDHPVRRPPPRTAPRRRTDANRVMSVMASTVMADKHATIAPLHGHRHRRGHCFSIGSCKPCSRAVATALS